MIQTMVNLLNSNERNECLLQTYIICIALRISLAYDEKKLKEREVGKVKRYDNLVNQYPKHLIFLKEGTFYNVRQESAYLIHHLLGFRMYFSRDEFCTGCPMAQIDKVLEILKEKQISYLVMNQDVIEAQEDFETNCYEDYQPVFEELEAVRKEEIARRKENVLDKEALRNAISVVQGMMSGENQQTGEELKLSDLIDGELNLTLKYVCDLLEKVLECGRIYSNRFKYQKPFYLPQDKAMQLITDKPVKVSEFVAVLNAEIDDTKMKRLTAPAITNWLLKQGYLYESIDEQKRKIRIATELGEELGITTEEHQGQNGIYRTNIYSQNAQQFLVQHLAQF